MRQMKHQMIITLIIGALTFICAPTTGWSQTADRLQQIEKRLAEKQTAAEAHRKQMETIKDQGKLTTEMQRHFQMTEEIIALMIERRQVLAAQAPVSGAGSASGMGGMGMMEHGMGQRQEPKGMQDGGKMEREMGMMQKETGGMQRGGNMGGGMMEKEMGGMAGAGMSGQAGSGVQSGAAKDNGEMTKMMQRLSEHSAYMETIKDRTQFSQEMLRHQRMLDQMLQLMQ